MYLLNSVINCSSFWNHRILLRIAYRIMHIQQGLLTFQAAFPATMPLKKNFPPCRRKDLTRNENRL